MFSFLSDFLLFYIYITINTFYVTTKTYVMISRKECHRKNDYSLQVFMTCLGWLSDPFKG